MYFKIFILSALFFLFISCDGYQSIEGIIVDSETHKPISDVLITDFKKGDTLGFTDEQGYFEIHQIKGFPIGDKELTVIISKIEYIQDTITFINNENRFVKLERIEQKK